MRWSSTAHPATGFAPMALGMGVGTASPISSRPSFGHFLSEFCLSLFRARLVDFGVQGGDESGWVSGAIVAQGIDYYCDTQTGARGSNLAAIPMKPDCGSPGVSALAEGEMVSSVLGLGDVDSFPPLMTITPLGLALSAELNSGTEVLGLENTFDISDWVKHKILGFSKLVGLPLRQHEKMCIVLLSRLERDMEVANLLHRKAVVH